MACYCSVREKFTPDYVCKIVKYADLDQYQTIYDLLPNPMDFVFLLTESELNSGHWTLIIRDGTNFEYFDSYVNHQKVYWIIFQVIKTNN